MNKTVGLIYKSIVIDEVFIARIIRRIYKDVIFDTGPVAGKVYKNSAVVVVIQLASPAAIRSAAVAGAGAPEQRTQGKIKRYTKIKRFREN